MSLSSTFANSHPGGRRWIVFAVIAVALVLGLVLWRHFMPRVSYETAAVKRGDIQATVHAVGTLQPRRYVDVGAQVSGQVTRLHVQPGDIVEQGQLLVEIDPSVQQAVVDAGRAAIAGLRAQLAEQQARHKLARLQYARQQRLAARQATRAEDVDAAQAEQASASARMDYLRAQIAQMQASQRAEEARLGYTQIYAPMAGTVVSVEAREGQTLNATYQTPNILRIADLSGMTVWTEVSEADVRRVKAGLPVSFTTLGGVEDVPRKWQSTVRQVLPAPPSSTSGEAASTSAPAAGTKAVTYTVLFDVDNHDGELMPQMTAQVSFVTAQVGQVIVVPLAALLSADGKYMARVMASDGTVRSRPVRLGVRSRLDAEVLDGLAEGESLVIAEQVREAGLSWLQW
ncbi:efflux RND transporter periplasmic adaptor subunit [Allopusillimonas ginsengisoli]|uniref:efflux RND transporter periplasmic adaptor subunit n=1 Tax=Allopusillimonas ginsengisoli TaxID=453575 RepID=UPI0010215BDC|nr:efflux RND transporter periplasmic adaptor subunit [Allopusillimonas ginsengisoli]TEA80177.1 efflux RND transporter periplasmic adaptor subunit [Allopusillimonas ginsengisoli]